MKPWDPILAALPGGSIPVAEPIRVFMPETDPEATWWAHLLATLWGLRTVYQCLDDPGQVYRTGGLQVNALQVVKWIYRDQADAINTQAVKAAHARLMHPGRSENALAIEVGLWAQAARCAHVLASTYAFHGGHDDRFAVLSADILRGVRERVACALPEAIAAELLDLATAPAVGASRVGASSPGTEPSEPSPMTSKLEPGA